MKAVYLFIAITAGILLNSCTSPKVPIIDLVILQDVTDSDINKVSYKEVESIFDFQNFLHYQVDVTYRELSDVNYGLTRKTSIPESNSNRITKSQRKRKVSRFLNATKDMIDTQDQVKTQKDKSVIFPAVAMELNRLATDSKATNKIMLIYSDLIENSDFFSLYNEEQIKALLHSPNKVMEHFQVLYPLEDLTGISVYIFYEADLEDDKLFYEMSKLYAYLLGAHGAEVHISSSPVTNYKIEYYE